MRVTFDQQADAAYVQLAAEVRPGDAVHQVGPVLSPDGASEVVLDFDAAGRLVGVEVLGATRALPPEVLAAAESP